ncbi:MAG: CinA family nicotinamide mononucleotide deamidase-related protein [Leptolyngbya sp. PLA1]|nr:CinA family nicotinamide mononucleotide deamidase-related protein [Leptolyngbya sp. PLA1]
MTTTAHGTAALLSIGDELTLGQTLDTNSKWIASALADLGIVTVEHVTVPDDLEAHAGTLRRLASKVDLIVSTGGLGPTADDLTRQALAEAVGEALVEDPVSMAQVRAWFTGRGREMPAINAVQALRPASAVALQNLHGTAPGLMASIGSCEVFCLPGPPGEARPMWSSCVVPRLRPPPGRTVRTRVLHTFGIGESDLATRLGGLMARDRSPLLGTTASGGVVSCRLRYEGPLSREEADALMETAAREVRARAGEFVFGEGDVTLPDAVLGLAQAAGQTVGVVESCTGGMLGQMLTDPAGASTVFMGGLVTYSNGMKTALAGVEAAILAEGGPGAVSEEAAAAMARGGLARLGVDHCLAVTGIAGPGGGSAGKPVGTVWIALASRGRDVDARRFRMSGARGAVRDWACKAALAMLRQRLAGVGPVKLLRQEHP